MPIEARKRIGVSFSIDNNFFAIRGLQKKAAPVLFAPTTLLRRCTTEALSNHCFLCPGGGIGRRTWFRSMRWQHRGSSSLLLGTIIQQPSRWLGFVFTEQQRRTDQSVAAANKVDEQSSQCAQVAELVDAHGSGPCGGNTVEVRVFSWAPLFKTKPSHWLGFVFSGCGKSSASPHTAAQNRARQATGITATG